MLLKGWDVGSAPLRGGDSQWQISEPWALPSRHKQHWFKVQVWVKW